MKKTFTTLNMNLKDRFQLKSKSIKLFAVMAFASTSIAYAQVPASNNLDEIETSKSLVTPIQRNPGGGTPIRNVTINPIAATISGLNMVDMGPYKVLVDWSNLANFDSIFFRFSVSGSANYRIIGIVGNPNPGRYFIEGLLSQTTYEIEVATKSGANTSTWSAPLTVTTLPEPTPRLGNPDGEGNPRFFSEVKSLPNPASGSTTLTFLSNNDNVKYNLKITSTTGIHVYRQQFHASKGENVQVIDLSNITPGLYMLRLTSMGSSEMIKLVVQ